MDHRERHKKLHGALDELAACFIQSTGKRLRETSVMELIEWSHKATLDVEACAATISDRIIDGPKGTGSGQG